MMRNRCLAIFAFSIASIFAAVANASIHFDFEDGTLEGWKTVLSDPSRAFAPTNTPGVLVAASGAYVIDGVPFAGRDNPHNTLLVRSPEFFLDGSGDLTISLAGGQGGGSSGQATMPTSPFELATTTSNNDGLHVMGVGLRLAGTNQYVATAQRSTNGENWELLTINQATLAPLVSVDARYTLDVFDSYAGGWSWISFDNVNVPGTQVPEPTSFGTLSVAMAMMVRRCRRRRLA